MRRRIAIVTNMWPAEGAAHRGIFVQQQVAALRAARPDWAFDVHTVAGERGRRDYLISAGRLRRALASGYDLVHAHYGLTGVTVALTGTRLPLVLTLHGDDANIGWQRALSRVAALRATRLIAVSDRIASRVHWPHVPVILPCGVDTNLFQPRSQAEARARLRLPPDRPVLLFPAHPANPVKDHGLFERALAALPAEVRAAVVTLELVDTPPADVPWMLAAADAVVLTSRSEGSPMVVKEALAAGVPVIATPVGDVPELLEGIPGCSIVARDAVAIAEAIAATLRAGDDGAARVRRDRVLERGMDGDTIARRLIELYEATVATGAAAAWRSTNRSGRIAR